MSGVGTLWRILPRPIRELPADLVGTCMIVVATTLAVFLPILEETPVRVPLGLAFVLFVPGYALVSALFPRGCDARRSGSRFGFGSRDNGEEPHPDDSLFSRPLETSLTGGERCVLSLALSVSVVPLVGLVLYFGLGTVAARPLVGALSAITLVATLIGAKRRHALPPAERFQPPVDRWINAVRDPASAVESRPAAAIHISVAIVLLLAVSSIGYAVVGPQTGEQFSEVSILTETNDGELVAGNYPTSFDGGENRELVFTVENRERRTVGYTVVVVEQAVENDSVVEQRELNRFETELEHGRTWNHTHDVQPTVSGETVRLAWLVYLDGDVPESPSLENAEYSTHRWIEVSTPEEPEEGGGGGTEADEDG
ncbi:DUF1616 domain-containing protein [Natrialba asiatica]|uniref:DUF1616 domain-containing protein n=1 Tax=Natrialba asiatica (strain ATCC 700177 / DSM 12278 / JCM 9576 / FERM P-10747 / NBRC 102637 / 172P1) TaxID=29540 RepID=M0B6Z8_NATA1|nr:DUF1616 domain-containing protein [Natrialba asiatica]ELZ06018.1 hypothetical protein C481_00760 [Natrialba asiatica DSM 12278]